MSSFFAIPPTTNTSTSTATGFAQPYWNSYLSNMSQLTANPMPVYGGPTVAPQNQMQQTANSMGYDLATGGSPAGNAANAQIVNQASTGGGANPYATTANPYMGNNPYLQQMIGSSNADITNAYTNAIAPQTDAANIRSGAYGGSGYQEQTGQNQLQLARALAQNTSNLQGQNYYNSGQLAENSLNRATNAFQNQQQNALQGSALGLQSQGMDWNAINGLNALGTQQQSNTQNDLGAQQQYFGNTVQAPFLSQNLMGNAISQATGGTGTTTQQLGLGQSYIPFGIAGGLASIFAALNGVQ
jgi:hypothetical protein